MHPYKSIFILFICFSCLLSCEEEEILPNGIVMFSEDQGTWEPEDGESHLVTLNIDPPAEANSEIRVRVAGLAPASLISTAPELERNEIRVPVSEGEASVSFEVIPSLDHLPVGMTEVEFELYYAGPGLDAMPFEGRFYTLVITKPREEPEAIVPPYAQDFTDCTGMDFPTGWRQEVVVNNNLQSAQWQCTGASVEINAFVGGSNDMSNAEVWLLTPRFDLTSISDPSFSFVVDRRFSPDDPTLEPFDLVISTDYNGTNFADANWQRFEPGYQAIAQNDPEVDDFTSTGVLDLSPYADETISIAFVYRAGAAGTVDATILRMTTFAIN